MTKKEERRKEIVMNKFLCLTLSAFSILGFSSAQATEEEWDRGYEIGFEDKGGLNKRVWFGEYECEKLHANEKNWSEDQKDGYLQGHWDLEVQEYGEWLSELKEMQEQRERLTEEEERDVEAIDLVKEVLNESKKYADSYKAHKEERRKEWERERE